jgi:hypothetical protein
MRSIRRTLKRPSLLPKTQRNHAVLLRIRFTTLWRSEIHKNLKIDADAPNRRQRLFCVRRSMYHISPRERRQDAGKSARVYGICNVKNKIEIENLSDCTSQPNLT